MYDEISTKEQHCLISENHINISTHANTEANHISLPSGFIVAAALSEQPFV